jgi:hypothetical protein
MWDERSRSERRHLRRGACAAASVGRIGIVGFPIKAGGLTRPEICTEVRRVVTEHAVVWSVENREPCC